MAVSNLRSAPIGVAVHLSGGRRSQRAGVLLRGRDTLPDEAFEGLRKQLDHRREAHGGEVAPSLTVSRADDFIQVVDGRTPETVGVHTFDGPLASLHLGLMDKPLILAMAVERTGLGRPVGEVTEALNEFVARGLMMRDRNLFLSLALPPGPSR